MESDKQLELNTHTEIDRKYSGNLVELDKGYAKVVLETTKEMVVDKEGLIHGGFIFSAADFAAMAAVNEKNVVLVSSQCRFLAPAQLGDVIVFEAREEFKNKKKQNIRVIGKVKDIKIFEAEMGTVVLNQHVLKIKLK